MRPLVLLLACALSCAFPPSADLSVDDDESCAAPCAGRCSSGLCVPSPRGGACDPTGAGAACVAGSECVGGRCVAAASCDGRACAGRCAEGACIPSEPGEACDPLGAGRACRVGACTGGRCPVPGPPPPVSLDEVAALLRDASCDWSERCGFSPLVRADACRALPHTFDSLSESVALVGRGEATYDAEAAGTCIAELSFTGCLSHLPEACERLFTGTGDDGAHCTASASCRASHWCAPGDGQGLSCIGTCTRRAQEGQACSGVPCAAGLACALEVEVDAWVERCRVRAPGTEGQSCSAAFGACRPGLFCNLALQRCDVAGEDGDDCDDALGCADGLVCASTLGVCLPLRLRGESCMVDAQCGSPLAGVVSDWCDGGTCAALPSSGACRATADRAGLCDPATAWCDDDRCVPLSGEGGSCVSHASCAGEGLCSVGSCATPFECP